jgi:hypothetical protein
MKSRSVRVAASASCSLAVACLFSMGAGDVWAQASAVGGASAQRLLPAVPSLTQVESVVRAAAPALPAGYAERSFTVRPGPISPREYEHLIANWGYISVECALVGLWTRYGNTCADGVNPVSFYPGGWIAHNPCSGQRWDRVYRILVSAWDHSGVGEGGSYYSYYEYFTCSQPKTYTTLYKITPQ